MEINKKMFFCYYAILFTTNLVVKQYIFLCFIVYKTYIQQRVWRKLDLFAKENHENQKNTDLGNLIGKTQCGNFRTFSAFQILREIILKPKNAILTISAALNFEFLRTFNISTVKFFQKSKFKASSIIKTAVFDLLKSAKTDFM